MTMAQLDGFGMLAKLRASSDYRTTPVIMLYVLALIRLLLLLMRNQVRRAAATRRESMVYLRVLTVRYNVYCYAIWLNIPCRLPGQDIRRSGISCTG